MEKINSITRVINQIAAWLRDPTQTTPDWSSAEWQLFKKAAFIHGVAPLLHHKLNSRQLPEQIESWLSWQYENNQQRITQIQSDLRTVLAIFSKNNIPLLPLKGAVLSAVYYPNIALRPTADIDLLITPQDFTKSLALLSQSGYEVEKSNWKHAILSRPNNRTIVSYDTEHLDNPRRIDLHIACQEMFSGPLIDITAEIWQSAEPGYLLGEKAYIITAEKLWLHLLLHTSSNIWNGVLRLINMVDIVHLEKTAPINLAQVQPTLKKIEPRFLYPAFFFCHKYFQHPPHLAPLQHIRPFVPASFHNWLSKEDLVSRSRLTHETKVDYIRRLILLYGGRPKDLLAAVRFLRPLFRKSFG